VPADSPYDEGMDKRRINRQGVVTSPSGVQWRVGRKWLSVSLPWRQTRGLPFRSRRAVASLGWRIDWQFTAALVPIAAVAIVLVPALLFGVELILAGLLVVAGAGARVVLRRPWLIQATTEDPTYRSVRWRAASFRESRQMIREVRSRIAAGWEPTSE